jgi:hypothetical protein
MVRQPTRLLNAMLIFYLTIPFMVLGTAIAVVPLIFAMRHEHALEQAARQQVTPGFHRDGSAQAA